MIKRFSVALLGALAWFSVASVAQTSREMQLINDAAATLGGKERILAVKTLTIEGYATNPNIGQAMTPEAEPLWWMIPDYKRSIDLVNGRMALTMSRRPAFPAVFDAGPARGAAPAAGVGAGARGGAAAGGGRGGGQPNPQTIRTNRLDMLQHPLTLVRAALDPAAKVTNFRQNGSQQSVDITTAQGDTLTLTVDALKRPVSVRTAVYHPNLGDTERVTTWDAWEELNGVRLPKRIVTRLDRWVEYDIGVMKDTLDADLSELAGTPSLLVQPPPATDAPVNTPNLPVTEVARGIWFVTGGGIPCTIVEFADHIALVEVSGGDARVQALIAKAKELAPGKPVTQAIVSHHHFDHTAGLRAAVAEGLTIITHRVNEAWFREAVTRKHTMQPDLLAKNPKPLKIISVDDSYTIKDASMEVTLYHLVNSTHGDGILAVYFPRERVYAEPDVWNPGAQIQPHIQNLWDDITRRKLQIDRVIPLHGNAVQPFSELEKTYAEWASQKATKTTYVPPGLQQPQP